jgi:hypothetical protein
MEDVVSADVNSQRNRVVARFRDGRLLKGYTHDFMPNKDTFHLVSGMDNGKETIEEVNIADLKSIFFVKTFDGNKDHEETKSFDEIERSRLQGIKIKVEFSDGEVMRGTSLGYNKTKKGFFVVPVDSQANNDRVYVVVAAVEKVVVGPAAEE